ncbi:NAD-dependent succinate-semialdehyde dehydrogenase [Pseudovibrio brasiliensis]|uniref:NAD-dependent succinate-semialdehyde dehydrogenase n=1 Tax=Pseudovibrio brasiliensis TaxID=1898042 RepID=A0ABX8ATF3_9HYPH|nr:NAD-dependent succinate-semialdehyde dehydrogenase [Pseudovibrio brasiliensis]QUS58343.1 NAD-dependent succinate-semialdehyde dehydrogenase [Pseudovibrio brasiliensis]
MTDAKLLIGGEWVAASTGDTRDVHSPVTGKTIGTIAAASADDIATALKLAKDNFPKWAAVPAWERAKVLRKAADLIRERTQDIARVMSTETGKPQAEAVGETGAAADQFEWYAEEAKRIYGQTIPGRNADERLTVNYQPVGPSLALSAWNFPALLPARKIAAALAAGCTVIARPASEAAGPCFAIGQALMDAGLMPGALAILTGDSRTLAPALINAPEIRKVSLTGSVPVGKDVMRQCADGMKKVTMELGGHAPVVIHKDFDPIAAAQKLAATKFRNCGQVCISPSRFYVHSSIAREFAEEFARYAKSLVVGDGLEEGVTTGPLIRQRAVDHALRLTEDAIAKGAELLAGGNQPENLPEGSFLEPTVLMNVPDEAAIMIEEPFAPVAPITTFDDVEDVIERANNTPFGLAAYVFSYDSALALKTADRLEAGMVGINETLLATAEAPFGGNKESGFGREGGSLGIMDYLVPKYTRHLLIFRDI